MERIIPAIIPQSLDHLRDTFLTIVPPAHEVQIDIVDGKFVPFTSWPYRGSGSVMLLREFCDVAVVEVDLMIQSPEVAIPLYVKAGVQKVVVHLETVRDFEEIVRHRDAHGYELGISVSNTTPLAVLTSACANVEYVQLMGIHDIGSQGQPFDTEVLERIKHLKNLFPELIISIDGSVNEKTIPLLLEAGADRFVSGSAILNDENPKSAYERLSALVR
jgi:ribulose-phosphate 3-epimerase